LLAERLNCPALTSSHGRTLLPDDHPLHLRSSAAGHFEARRQADLILVIGSCLGEIDLPFDKYWGGAHQKIIQIDIDPRNLGVHRPIFKGIVADAAAALGALNSALAQKNIASGSHVRINQYQTLSEEESARALSEIENSFESEKIHPAQSIKIIQDLFGNETVYVYDGGNTGLFARTIGRFTKPRSLMGNFEFGHLGTGIPHAIGAKVADPGSEVVCITGDGAAGFNIMEMETAVRENIKITVIVHAEGSWSMEETIHRHKQASAEGMKSCYMAPTRWDQIAQALGCHGEYVERIEDLSESCRRALAADRPALICVKTDPYMTLNPPGLELFDEVYFGPRED